jgi:hypothetical protein
MLLQKLVAFRQTAQWRMLFSGMLRHVALVITDVLEELSAFIIRVTRIGELGTILAVTSTQHILLLQNVRSYRSHTAQDLRRRHSS